MSTAENIDAVHDLILENRRIGLKRIAEKISYARVFHTVYQELDMTKLFTKWIPKCMNGNQKRQRVTT